jgi:putative PIN family toxin of toxin-antitoxin system
MKPEVVFDTNVIVSATGWRGPTHLLFVALARRRYLVYSSAWILAESQKTLTRLKTDGKLGKHDPWPVFNWFCSTCRRVELSPTGKRRSRDPKDDPILATALSARCKLLVAFDKDLLSMGKPFGIEIIKPSQFLFRLGSLP